MDCYRTLNVRTTPTTSSKVEDSDFQDKIAACYQRALLLHLSFRGWTAEISRHTNFFTDETLSLEHDPPQPTTPGLAEFPPMFIYGI